MVLAIDVCDSTRKLTDKTYNFEDGSSSGNKNLTSFFVNMISFEKENPQFPDLEAKIGSHSQNIRTLYSLRTTESLMISQNCTSPLCKTMKTNEKLYENTTSFESEIAGSLSIDHIL
jgi:hypothetical protein